LANISVLRRFLFFFWRPANSGNFLVALGQALKKWSHSFFETKFSSAPRFPRWLVFNLSGGNSVGFCFFLGLVKFFCWGLENKRGKIWVSDLKTFAGIFLGGKKKKKRWGAEAPGRLVFHQLRETVFFFSRGPPIFSTGCLRYFYWAGPPTANPATGLVFGPNPSPGRHRPLETP